MNLQSVIGAADDACADLMDFCAPRSELAQRWPLKARLLKILAGRLLALLAVTLDEVEGRPGMTMATPNGKRLDIVARWLSTQGKSIAVTSGGVLVRREVSGPWFIIGSGKYTLEQAVAYVKGQPGTWSIKKDHQLFPPTAA